MSAAAWAFLASAATGVAAWARTAWERRRSSPQTTAVLMGVSLELVDGLRQQITELRTDVDVLRARVRELEQEVHSYRNHYGPLP